MRILSWNIERGYKIEKIIPILLDLEPDILLLQEVDKGVGRTEYKDIAKMLQDVFPNYYMYWSLEFKEIPSIWRKIIPIGGKGGGEHGNLILSRYPFFSRETISLPTNKNLPWRRTTIIPELFEPRIGYRIAQICEINTPKGNIFIANTHFENWRSSPKHRELQFQKILECYLERQSSPWIIGGDMNTISGFLRFNLKNSVNETKSFRNFAEKLDLFDPFSNFDFTSKFGVWEGKIDWLPTNRKEKVKNKFIGPKGLSDHRYLCVDVDF